MSKYKFDCSEHGPFYASDKTCPRCEKPVIPAGEAWLHQNKDALASVKRGLEQSANGEISVEASAARKNKPLFSGVLMYFPDALLAVAEHSKRGNDKHNPGQPLHWAREKSKDQADCIARHLVDIGPDWDAKDQETGSYHATALAWRALAVLQTVLEREAKKNEPIQK
jgi:hypothetical protein